MAEKLLSVMSMKRLSTLSVFLTLSTLLSLFLSFTEDQLKKGAVLKAETVLDPFYDIERMSDSLRFIVNNEFSLRNVFLCAFVEELSRDKQKWPNNLVVRLLQKLAETEKKDTSSKSSVFFCPNKILGRDV